jgi:hypothetical protein
VSKENSFEVLQAHDRNAPRVTFDEFVEDWYDLYQRERSVLRRNLESLLKDRSVDISCLITPETTYKAFKDLLTDDSKHAPADQKEAWEIINGQNPVSSAVIFYKDLLSRAKAGGRPSVSTGIGRRSIRQDPDESSEDEGEIIEDAEDNTHAHSVTKPSEPADPYYENATFNRFEAGIADSGMDENVAIMQEVAAGEIDVESAQEVRED